MNISEEFSNRLRDLMNERGLSMADLARLLHTQPSTLTRWFRGSRPQRNSLIALADVLRVRPSWLADGKGPRESGKHQMETITESDAPLMTGEESEDATPLDPALQVILAALPPDQLTAAVSKISASAEPLTRPETQALFALVKELGRRPAAKVNYRNLPGDSL